MQLAHDLSRLAQMSAPDAMTVLDDISTALDTLDDPDAFAALAAVAPTRVEPLAPEVSVALAQILERLIPYGVKVPVDVDALSDRPRLEWLRVCVIGGGTIPSDSDLWQMVQGWSVHAIPKPLPILSALAKAEHATARLVCLTWLPDALAGLGISIGDAFELACDLAVDPAWMVSTRALASGAFNIRFGLSLQQESRREDAILAGLQADDLGIAKAAVQACARLGRVDWLRDFADDDSRAIHLRAEALAAVGPLAEPADLPWALGLAQMPGLASACRQCVLAAHRCGTFLDADSLDAVLAQFDGCPEWTASDLLRVTFVVRDALVARLAQLPPDDLRWLRRARLLAETGVEAAAPLLSTLLGKVTNLRVATAFIDAAGRSPGFTDVVALLNWLARAPEAALVALRVKIDDHGHQEAIECFARAPATAPRLRRLAMETVWAQHDNGLLGRAGCLAEWVVADPESDLLTDPAPAARLTTLCAAQSRMLLPQVTSVFRTCVIDCVRRALAGDFSVKRVELPAIEQQIFRYGRSLIAAGQVGRSWHADTPETGRDLVLLLICEWLDEAPERALMVALLEMAARHAPDGPWLRRIESFWRHPDREVQRAAVDAILGAGESAAGLALSLSRLVEAASPRIAQRGLEAIGAFEARWAEPLVLRALTRPEMAVKRAAAEALRTVASAAAVPTILDWLGRHDNHAFRTALRAALATAAGHLQPVLLVEAYAAQAEPRSRGLLIDAVSGLLPMGGLLRMIGREHPAAEALTNAVLDGRLRLADASKAEFEARLHRLRVREAPDADDPTKALRLQGFMPDRAATLLSAWVEETDKRCIRAVGRHMAEWLAWCPNDEAAALALRAAGKEHGQWLDGLLDLAPRVATAIALPFIGRCVTDPTPAQRQRAIDLVRALPDAPKPGGVTRMRQLRALGAVITRADLERCLGECVMGPDMAQSCALVLLGAFEVPNAAGESYTGRLTARIRETADAWNRISDAERTAFLDALLLERPLGLPVPIEVNRARVRTPRSIRRLVEALADPQTAKAAQTVLYALPVPRSIWVDVLRRVLTGELDGSGLHRHLANTMTRWPTDPAEHAIALRWISWLEPAQLRTFIPEWIARRARGDANAQACLEAVNDDLLLPEVWARKADDPTLARLISPADTEGFRALTAWLLVHAPDEAKRFERPEKPAPEDAVVDPLAGLDLHALRRLIEGGDTGVGLAVRAVHALTASKDAAIEPLAGLVVDDRPKVRSAALRALRSIAPRQRSLDATCDVLRMEDRQDVVLQLMRSLGHGRHLPGLPLLIDRLVHRKPRIVDGARDALVGFGDAAVPALEHAARRARPDRRDAYRAVIAAIEG